MTDLGDKLTEMAESLIRDVASEETALRVAAFKAVSQFYIATSKIAPKPVEDDDNESSLVAMRERVKAAGAGQ